MSLGFGALVYDGRDPDKHNDHILMLRTTRLFLKYYNTEIVLVSNVIATVLLTRIYSPFSRIMFKKEVKDFVCIAKVSANIKWAKSILTLRYSDACETTTELNNAISLHNLYR